MQGSLNLVGNIYAEMQNQKPITHAKLISKTFYYTVNYSDLSLQIGYLSTQCHQRKMNRKTTYPHEF